jgi:hypothetical protein
METTRRLGAMGLVLTGAMAIAARVNAYDCDAKLSECATVTADGATGSGSSLASGFEAVAMGHAEATAPGSVAIGHTAWAHHENAIAIGGQVFAEADDSIALGYYSRAEADAAVTIGYGIAWGVASFSLFGTAFADGSVAIHGETYGANSFSFGGNMPQAYDEVVVGRCNVTSDAYNPDEWVDTDPLFVVGNGECSHDWVGHNALTILKNGNMGINDATPSSPLQVQGGSDVSPDSGGQVVIGSTAADNLAMDSNEIAARNNGATSVLHLNADGGEVSVGATLRVGTIGTASYNYTLCSTGSSAGLIKRCPSSSRRYKENIVDLALGLAEVERLRPVSFIYRDSGQHSFGFIAEEVAEIYPDFAVYDEQGRPESVRYGEMTALLTNAVQELNADRQELAATVKSQAAVLNEQAVQLKAQATELAELRASVAKQQQMLETLAADVARLSR